MADATLTYPSARRAMREGRWHPPHDSLRIVLLDDSYTPSASHSTYVDVAPFEVHGFGYQPRGKLLEGQRIEEGDDEDRLLCEATTWEPVEIDPSNGYTVVMLEDGTLLTCTKLGGKLSANERFRVPGGVVMRLK